MKNMDRKYLLSIAALALVAAPLTAAAWTHGKPGLWATTVEMSFSKGGPPPIAPEQLEKMKQMGIKLPFGEPVTTNICITPEQAAQDQPPKPPQRDNSCQTQNLQKSGNSFSGDLVCNGAMNGSGHFQSTYLSDESYAGTMDFAGTSKHGEVAMNNKFSGKWLSADCGSVKPFDK
ncbi:MAG: hypothetical protein JWR16_1067 [Nevskia sp.]|nr:hypothetical protein [Nevskia sp.]